MPLQRQNIPVPLAMGADTKTDSYLLPPGKLTVLQNGYLTKSGTVRKRPGHVSLGNSVVGGGTMGAGQGLAAYLNELVVMDTTALYSYAPSFSAFAKKGSLVSCSVTQSQVVRTTGTQTAPDIAVNATTGLTLLTYNDTTAGVSTLRYSILDTATGQVLVNNQLLATNSGIGKPLAVTNGFVVIYNNTSDFNLYMIPFAGTTQLATVTVATTLNHGFGAFDACIQPGVNGSDPLVCIAWNTTDVGGGCAIRAYSATTLVAYGTALTLETGNAAQNITVFPDQSLNTTTGQTSQRLIVAYTTGTATRIVSCTNSISSGGGIADQQIEVISGATCLVGCSFATNNAYSARVYYTVSTGSNRANDKTRYVTIAGNTVTAAGDYVRSLSVMTKPFVQAGQMWITLSYDPNNTGYTGQQPTYFVVSDSAVCAARLLYGNGGGFRNAANGGEVVQTSTGVWQVALLQKDLLTTVPASPNLNAPPAQGTLPSYVYTATGVTTAALNFFDQQQSYFRTSLANTLFVSGGLLQQYDGTQVVEHGFHLSPEGVTVTMAGAGGSMSAGQYAFYVTYEWTDAQGRLHRSAPSPGVIVTAAANDKATVTVPTLRFTQKTNVQVVVYRTLVNGTVPYRLGSPASPLLNSTTADTVQLVDGTADSSISSAPPIYVLGNVAENIPLGPCTGLTTFKDRVLAISSDNPYNVWFSKPTQNADGVPVEFNDGFYINVDALGGPLTAVEVMDDKIVLFKADRIMFSSGDGPDSTGQNGAFAPPQLVTTDCGCVDPRSVAVTPQGLMFRGRKGIYLLDRGLRVTYIGAPVENKLGSYRVVSATLSPNTQQVKFGLSDNQTVLVYDYLNDQWSWNTNPELASVAGVIFQTLYTFLQPSGVVGQESLTTFTDFGNFIPLVLETGWFNLAQLNGYVRLYGFELLGRYYSAHTLRVSLAYDNANAWVKSGDLSSYSLFDSGTWGGTQTPTWGGTPPTLWGGPDSTLVARFDPAQQKCRTFKLRIEDMPFGQLSYGESLALTGLTLSVGAKSGLGKLPATQQVGVS